MSSLFVVSTPIGNLEDVTVRAARVLAEVKRVLAEDTRRSRVLLDHLAVSTPLVSLHAHNEAARIEAVLSWLDAGEDLALVSDAGTPLVSDPGARLVSEVVRAGHTVVPVPGASAVLAALVASGLPTERFTFLGFLPRKGGKRGEWMARIGQASEATVIFESPQRLVRTLSALADTCEEGRLVSVARELTKLHETVFRGTLVDAVDYYGEYPPRGEVTVVIGPAPAPGANTAEAEDQARDLADGLRAEGLRDSEIVREVSERLGIRKNLAYRIVHATDD